MTNICIFCNKEMKKGEKLIAFDEFVPEDYQWEELEESGEVDEVEPLSGGWFLAHYWCVFNEESK